MENCESYGTKNEKSWSFPVNWLQRHEPNPGPIGPVTAASRLQWVEIRHWPTSGRNGWKADIGTALFWLRFAAMTHDKLYNEATEVRARDGDVILDGPDGVDVKVTPEAAEQTADNLIEGAVKARGQRRLKNLPHKPQ